MKTQKTAVLIFDSFQNEKGIGTSFIKSKRLYNVLTDDIVKKVEVTGLDYFHYTEKEQKGNSFGQCFSNAISDVYSKGYDAVITIGNDIPNLESHHIIEAKQRLDNNEFVLGPSYDGGFYLMALQKEYFEASLFEKFSWNSSKVALEIKEYIEKFTTDIILLKYLYDIDTLLDLKSVFKTLSVYKKRLRLIIQDLIQIALFVYTYIETLYIQTYTDCLHNKGSPLI